MGRSDALADDPGAPYAEHRAALPGSGDRLAAAAWSHVEARLLRRRRLRAAGRIADAALALAPAMGGLGEQRFLAEATALRERLVGRGLRPELVAAAFAMAREATRRQLGLAHHRVQLIGGAAMLGRTVAEMETGEGKTLTALLPAALFALAGRPVHVVTVNDYLAERDASQLAPVYGALGLSVGTVMSGQGAAERRAAYARDVAYCTNKDLVFDYLRDRLAVGTRRSGARRAVDALVGTAPAAGDADRQGQAGRAESLLLRGLHVAIVDEADSVLIDESRTPLILSGTAGEEETGVLYGTALALARALRSGRDFTPDQQRRSLRLTVPGQRRLEELAAGLPGLWRARRAREELAEQALSAITFFHRDVQYVVQDGKVQIVDEYTGRVMPDRSWENGLHQVIEAKEGCAITPRRRTIARITYQRFFTRYGHLCGMTGTAAENRAELAAVYRLRVLPVPTHHAPLRRHLGTRLIAASGARFAAVASRAREVAGTGRAVLIGTRSVGASEQLAALLADAGLRPAVLNAQQSREEAAIVARAGQPGQVTVATNMAGRGTDIRLSRAVREAGGLHVILTEHHESQRIDRQLFGRCARQGDPGSVEAIVALDDEVFVRFAGARVLRLARVPLAGPAWLAGWAVRLLVRVAQFRAERANARMRRNTIAEDARLEKALAFAGRGE